MTGYKTTMGGRTLSTDVNDGVTITTRSGDKGDTLKKGVRKKDVT